jgi:5'(3')-deoxyribonucleotidase
MSQSTQVTFSPEEDVKLAELVSGHPCIFNAQHALYKNQGVRDNVWQNISEDMNNNGN